MLEITTMENELYDPKTNKFIQIPSTKFTIEHSLISLAKWESKWHIPFFSDSIKKTSVQDLDYIRCMVIGTIPNNYIFETLSMDNFMKIKNYMDNPMTATTFHTKTKNKSKKEITTAESIYAHMFYHNVPIDCQKWHLNRLLTLLRVCDLRNAPREKMTKKQTAAWNAEQNAARRAKLNSRG